MRVVMRPIGGLRMYLKEYMDNNNELHLFVDEEIVTIRELLERFKFDINKVGYITCNNNIANPDDSLKDGDRITVMTLNAGV
jgi:sulfur carrier protein ThiS